MYNYSMIYTYVQVWVWSLSSRVLLPLEEEVLRKLDSLGAGTKVPFSPGKALRPGGRACRSRFPPFSRNLSSHTTRSPQLGSVGIPG